MKNVFKMLGDQGWGWYETDATCQPLRRTEEESGLFLVPGFVDVHIHGAFGIDFLSASTDEMIRLLGELEEVGYEALLPTTVTAPAEVIKDFLSRLPEHRAVAGIHLEGPFISPKHPGAQPPSAISPIPPAASEWDEIFDDPRLRLITLAPELPNAKPLIERLVGRGVIVSLGHTDATYDEVERAVEWGVSHATHTFNAMRGLHHREAGSVGAVLTDDHITAELIYDRLHVSRPAAEILIRTKPTDRITAVSDGTQAAGMASGTSFEMWGLRCIVGDGEVRLESGTLAGSGITLDKAFRNLWDDFGPEVAIRAACLNPRRELGMGGPNVWLVLNSALEIEEILRP